MASETYDYVIVGGGTAGCVLASRLSHAGHSVLVLESGPEDYSETIMLAAKAPFVFESPVVQRVFTSPQKHLADRPLFTCAGRLLGGSSSVNQANWTRTHSADYDEWSDLVGDKRWSYSGLLPYFKKVETHYDTSADPAVHGFDGPIHVTAGATKFPLHEPVKQALLQAGLKYIPDINTGNPLGVGPFTENWKDAQRQPAGKAYDLSKATVRTGTSASKVVISSDGRATGVQLADGTTVSASREVLLCAGSIQTPKLLMLSGVGHAAHLKGLDIPVRADLPVGDNLHDHLSSTLYFKLKHPEQGLAAGHPKFDKPEYYAGNPIEWIATCAIDEVGKHAAAHGVPAHDPRVRQERAHTEIFVTYAPLVAPVWFKDGMSMFGSYISSTVLTLLPRSHGTIRLKSTDPGDDPLIDPNYNSHPMDRVGFRQGVRTVLNAMLDTEAGKGFVAEETPPDGMKGLSSKSSDAEIDERFAKTAMGFFQMAGTASMGKVVDTDLKVKGIKGLRVVDASVIPVPLAGHYQCPVYAMAESAADLVLQDAK